MGRGLGVGHAPGDHKQRLLHSSPDEVWRAMERYGRHVAQRSSLFYDANRALLPEKWKHNFKFYV